MKKLLLATLLGALAAYVWSTISYMALTWHNLDFNWFNALSYFFAGLAIAAFVKPAVKQGGE